jgi:DNA-binding CsgD family transcriptional regulator
MALSSTELRALVNVLEELYAPAGPEDYPARVISLVSGLISVGSCSYNHLDGSRALAYEIQPTDVLAFPDSYALFELHLPEHPVLSYVEATGDGSACRVSDLVSDREFRSLGLYRDFYSPAEVDYQLGFLVPYAGGGEIAVALNRKGRDFSTEERDVLDLLRPHVAQAAAIAAMLSQPIPENFDESGEWPRLTVRQKRILQLVADGYADREVGRNLGISTRTVHAHLQHIYRALDVTSRTEALARLRERSLTASGRRASNAGPW